MLNWSRCLFWSVNKRRAVSFCFSLMAKSLFWFCKFRQRACQTRISSEWACRSCGSSALVFSYLASAESWRLCNVRNNRFSFNNSCTIEGFFFTCHLRRKYYFVHLRLHVVGHRPIDFAVHAFDAVEPTLRAAVLRCERPVRQCWTTDGSVFVCTSSACWTVSNG